MRYNANGAVDTDFGTGGKITTNFSGTDYAWDMALRPDGKIVVVGAAGTSMAVALLQR